MIAIEITEDMERAAATAAEAFGMKGDLHPEDQLLRHITKRWGCEAAGKRYIEGGRVDAGKVRDMIERLRIDKPSLRILDFAAGFGRVTRHIKKLMPTHRVEASDIHLPACDFMEDQLGIRSYVSAPLPADLKLAGGYDVIFVLSLFSHLPEKTFGPWIGALFDLVAPGGYLFFTANGHKTMETFPEFYSTIFPPGARFGFRSESDQEDLDGADYGSAMVSMRFVLDVLDEYAPDGILHAYSSGGWLGTQDGWTIRKPG